PPLASPDHRDSYALFLSFPTRRSSDLIVRSIAASTVPIINQATALSTAAPSANQNSHAAAVSASRWARDDEFCASETSCWMPARSEEHTSELQSRFDLVCPLLLAKKIK